jgi:hypothetical protein
MPNAACSTRGTLCSHTARWGVLLRPTWAQPPARLALCTPPPCSWHFNAQAMCEYSRKEFEDGMAALGCDSLDKLRAKLPSLRTELQDPQKFRQIYQFAYLFSRCVAGWQHVRLAARCPCVFWPTTVPACPCCC